MPKPGKRADLKAWIEAHRPERIDLALAAELRTHLAPISESYFRKLLRDAGVPLAPLVEGVRQDDFQGLEASLLALLAEYEMGDHATRALARSLVVAAKEHAQWSKNSDKSEMLLWMRTWLENPPLFPQWLQLRKNVVRVEPQAETPGT